MVVVWECGNRAAICGWMIYTKIWTAFFVCMHTTIYGAVQKWRHFSRGGGGSAKKWRKVIGGRGGVSPKVTILNKSYYITLHKWVIRGGGGVSQKVTKSDRGEGGVSALFSKVKVTSFLDSPLLLVTIKNDSQCLPKMILPFLVKICWGSAILVSIPNKTIDTKELLQLQYTTTIFLLQEFIQYF